MSIGRASVAVVLPTALLLSGCMGDRDQPRRGPSASATSPALSANRSSASAPLSDLPIPTGTLQSSAFPKTTEPPSRRIAHFRQTTAMATVRHLAFDIGPRLATSPAFDRAASWLERRLSRYGYRTSLQTVKVPAGSSWGVPVDAGTSANVIATPPDFHPDEPWRLVGAHLDTVAVAPGAEDNGSGVAVLLELARLAAGDTTLPTVFIAFGAEEPVGDGEALHHFGSRLHVDQLSPDQLGALRAMVSLDRVGVSADDVVPVCTGGVSPLHVRDDLAAVARDLHIRTTACTDNTTSDHWSYEQRGVAVARIGSTPYAGYHSAGDVPGVISPAQLRRVGRIMWAWLRA